MNIVNKSKLKILSLTPVQWIVLAYFLTTLIAAVLLSLPVSLKSGVRLSFTDAFFTAASAISVTGLTVVNTAETFSVFGVFVLMFVMQFGGIGIMTLMTYIYILLGRNIGLSRRKLIMIDQNRGNLTGLVYTVKLVLRFSIWFELCGTVIFGTYFWIKGIYPVWYQAYYYGLFHTLSSYTNAGFDIFGNSLYSFSHDYFVQAITIFLIVLGAIGFPVLIELYAKFSRKYPHFRFSLFTKLTTFTYVLLILCGGLGIFLLERNAFFADLSWHEKLFHSLFFSVTPRSAGFSTLDVNMFGTTTLFFISVLMFIGASPSSVGGGIRTTTFAVVLLTLYAFVRGKTEVQVFKRRLANEDIMKSFVVFNTAVLVVSGAIIVLDSIEYHRHDFLSVIFEICSAFGTTGLSMGITPELTEAGKWIVSAVMFIGRIGILSFLLFLSGPHKAGKIRHPEEKIIIG